MRITIRQIAEQSGLSIQTVSRILNGNADTFRPDTQERVLRTAQELGYRPNTSARAMRSGAFGAFALLLSTYGERSLLPSELLDGLLEGTTAHNLSLHIARLPDETLASPVALPKVLRELSVDGLLIKYDSATPPQMSALIEKSGLPALWINSKQTADCIYPDDFGAARQATEHLLSLGHRRIAYVDWEHAGHYSRADRLAGYRESMEAAGLEPRDLWPHIDRTDAGSIRRTFDWLVASDRPTALLTYHDKMALAVYHAALLLGLRIPQDLSLMTISDDARNPIGPSFAAMLLPLRRIGNEAVAMLLEKRAEPDQLLAPRAVPQKLHLGATTGSPQ